MLILGLAGQAGAGKNEVANHLVQRYGFVQFAFSDALYHEVQQAFGLEDQSLLRDRATKETPIPQLAIGECHDKGFQDRMMNGFVAKEPAAGSMVRSPRQILQWWGTEYRRAQDENYWVKRVHEFVKAMHFLPPYPELRPALFVETGTRFENEREWIKALGGNVWHIHRGSDEVLHDHASAAPLPVLPPEREIWNNGTIEELHMAVDMLLSSNVEFVKCEPMEGT